MKIFRGLQSEKELGAVVGTEFFVDTSLKHDCQIWLFKILNFSKLFNFWAFVFISNKNSSLIC